MQASQTLHSSISRIQVASDDCSWCQQLQQILAGMAPLADIRCTHTIRETTETLTSWRPVLLMTELVIEGDRFLGCSGDDVGLLLAPFTFGVMNNVVGDDIVLAMRCGFVDVMVKPATDDVIAARIISAVTRIPGLPLHVGCMIHPYLYSGKPILMKQLLDDIDRLVFDAALQVTTSKSGLGKMLGISRQLVQYHLKKRCLP